MAITANNFKVMKLNENQVEVTYDLSDGTRGLAQFVVDTEVRDIKDAIKVEVARLNAIDAKVAKIAKGLEGVIIS
jgi:hypothetical protein